MSRWPFRDALFVGGPLDGEVRRTQDVPYFHVPHLDLVAALYVPDGSPPPSLEAMRPRVTSYRRSRAQAWLNGGPPASIPIYILDSLTTVEEVDVALLRATRKAGPLALDYLRQVPR